MQRLVSISSGIISLFPQHGSANQLTRKQMSAPGTEGTDGNGVMQGNLRPLCKLRLEPCYGSSVPRTRLGTQVPGQAFWGRGIGCGSFHLSISWSRLSVRNGRPGLWGL